MNVRLDQIVEIIKSYDYFEIPFYQRNYTWDEKQEIKEFLNDIENFIEKKEDLYFLGNIITKPINSDDNNSATLIDGQQRITTFLLCVCSYKKIIKKLKDFCNSQTDIFWKKYNIKEIEQVENKIIKCIDCNSNKNLIKLQRINDQDHIAHILNDETESVKNENFKSSNYYKIYLKFLKYFNTKFEECKEILDFENLFNFWNIGLEKIKIVEIILDKNQDEQLIFESLNSKGKNLSPGDLIKNYIIMCLEKNKCNENAVKKFENNFLEQFDNEEEICKFWRQMIAVKTGKLISEKSKTLYLRYKDIFPPEKINEQLIDEINNDKLIWDYVKNINDAETKDKILYKSQLLNYYVLIYHIYKFNSSIQNNKLNIENKNNIDYAISFLSKLIVARVICNFGRVESNRGFAQLGYEFGVNYDHYTNDFKKQFKEIVIDKLNNNDSNMRMPNISEIENLDFTKNIYTNHKNELKWIFIAIEKKLSGNELSKDKLEIEHIFPQNPKDEWGVKFNDESWDKWINTLGNLSIIDSKNNKELGNQSFVKKQEILKSNTYLKINKCIYEYQTWNVETIKDRARWVLNQINEIWKYSKND